MYDVHSKEVALPPEGTDRYVLVMVDCFTRWTEAFPLPDKTAQSVADAFFIQVVCRFGMRYIPIKDGNLIIESCRNCVCWVVRIRRELPHTIPRVMEWLNVSIGHYL